MGNPSVSSLPGSSGLLSGGLINLPGGGPMKLSGDGLIEAPRPRPQAPDGQTGPAAAGS